MTIRTALCDRLGIRHPILLAGMGGVAYAPICAAVADAGGYGTLGMALLPPEEIRRQMREVKEITDKPFGVDLLAALPDQVEASIDIIIEEGAHSFIAGLAIPTNIMQRLKDAGILVMLMCGAVDHARRGQDAGVDIVIAQGAEAGGHTGRIGGMALTPQIVDAVDIPVVAAGSITDGRGFAAALALGAQGVWVGTRFIASEEAHAGPQFKSAILGAKANDAVLTRAYSGKPMRVYRNSFVDQAEDTPESILAFPDQLMKSVREKRMGITDGVLDLDPTKDCMPMGQGAGSIYEILPCAKIIDGMVNQAQSIMSNFQAQT